MEELYFGNTPYNVNTNYIFESNLFEDEQKNDQNSQNSFKTNLENVLKDSNKTEELLQILGAKNSSTNDKENNEQIINNLDNLQKTIQSFSITL